MAELNSKQIATLEALLVSLQEVVDSIQGQDVVIIPETAKRIEQFKREARCLVCELPLGTKKVVSGCHPACAQKVRRKIDAGKFNLQHAVDRGWINPIPEPPGPKSKRPDPTRGDVYSVEAEADENARKAIPPARRPLPGKKKSAQRRG